MKKTPVTICFFHGLGSSKNAFTPLINQLDSQYTIHSYDFVGFGARTAETLPENPLDFSVNEIYQKIQHHHNVIFVAHSMGSMVALEVAAKCPDHIKAVIIIEGNLISEDCGYLSRKIATENDDNALEQLKINLRQEMSASPHKGWRDWSDDVKAVSTQTLRQYAKALVKKSDSGTLLSIFENLGCQKLYIYSEEYLNHPITEKLRNVKQIFVKGSGHFAMVDKPKEVADYIEKLCNRL